MSPKYIVILLLIDLYEVKSQGGWNYEDTKKWGDNFRECNGKKQSPIALTINESRIKYLEPLKFDNYDEQLEEVILRNNGRMVEAQIPNTVTGKRPSISKGTLTGIYEAQAFHFHWGSSKVKGSEHTVNGHRYDIEMHIVHKNTKYQTVEEAQKHADGLVVLGQFLDSVINPEKYSKVKGLMKIFDKLPDVTTYTSSAALNGTLKLQDILGNYSKYYNYQGSLTAPPCSEAVNWIVSDYSIRIPRRQIAKFWEILDENNNHFINSRPLQDKNGRPIVYAADEKLIGG